MAKFEKGHSKLPNAGRKKGTPNKKTQNYADLQLWYSEAINNINELEFADKRLPWIVQILQMLMAKVANLPTTPGESVDNAMRAQAMLSSLESQPLPSTNGTNGDHANA